MATVLAIEEGRAASKSHHEKFVYFVSISQQAVSADISKNSAVGNIMQYLNHEYWNKHIYSTWKGFEECVRRGNCPSSNFKILKVYKLIGRGSLPKGTAEIKTGIAEKSIHGTRQADGKTWFGLEKKKEI
jgi:hypothetical protein